MPRRSTFRRVTKGNLAWHLELKEGDGAQNYSEWLRSSLSSSLSVWL